jgi:hypothetical protein
VGLKPLAVLERSLSTIMHCHLLTSSTLLCLDRPIPAGAPSQCCLISSTGCSLS